MPEKSPTKKQRLALKTIWDTMEKSLKYFRVSFAGGRRGTRVVDSAVCTVTVLITPTESITAHDAVTVRCHLNTYAELDARFPEETKIRAEKSLSVLFGTSGGPGPGLNLFAGWG